MNPRDLWDRYRAHLIDLPELGFRLDCSRMDLPESAFETMAGAFAKAFDAMEALEAGERANVDENRTVGHYWLRAPQLAPQPDVTESIRKTIRDVTTFSSKIHDGSIKPPGAVKFERFLVVGIGGSALGPQFVADALGGNDDRLRPAFLDNTDPDGIDRVLDGLRDVLDRTLVVVISKSGGTAETRNGMLETRAAFNAEGLDFGPHAVAITGPGSRLDRFAEEENFIARFPMWDWVGGRTSETSVVGLLPAALQGFDIDDLLAGAAAMDEATRVRDLTTNPAAMLALAWHHEGDGRGAKDMVILPYRDRLRLFSRYLQQLVMESLGKERDLAGNVVQQGIAVYGNKGSTDQHAYVQQLRDGVANFFATFVEVLHERDGANLEVEDGVTSGDYLAGFLLGTRKALHDNGRHSLTITVDRLTPFAVGLLIALYERAVGLYAGLVGINAYHQPGVEAGKKAAAAVLELQRNVVAELANRGAAGAGVEQLAAAVGAADEVESIFQVLERLCRNPGRGVERRPGSSPFDSIYALKETDDGV
jgi:glucose-6-phosphate isomerase